MRSAALAVLIFATPALAQPEVRPGERVRLRVAAEVTRAPRTLKTQPVVGIIRSIGLDTLYLDLTPANAAAVPRILIQRVDRSLGPPSRRQSAGEGAYFGALLGLLIPPVLPKRTAAFVRGPDEGRMVGLAAGFLLGALTGYLLPYERWRPAWIPER